MSKTKFTKGPYRVGADMENICLNRGTDEDYTSNGWAKKLATVHWKESWMSAEESFANAKLFAAAPEMYEGIEAAIDELKALELITSMDGFSYTTTPIVIKQLETILAKARGE